MLVRALPLLLLLLVTSCSSQPSVGDAQRRASDSWLTLIDKAAYEQSWEASAELFQKAIGKQNWVRQIASVRRPMGQLISRTLASSDVKENLAGQPPGIYTIFIYRSVFRGKGEAVETHTVYRADRNQPWQNAGYYIK